MQGHWAYGCSTRYEDWCPKNLPGAGRLPKTGEVSARPPIGQVKCRLLMWERLPESKQRQGPIHLSCLVTRSRSTSSPLEDGKNGTELVTQNSHTNYARIWSEQTIPRWVKMGLSIQEDPTITHKKSYHNYTLKSYHDYTQKILSQLHSNPSQLQVLSLSKESRKYSGDQVLSRHGGSISSSWGHTNWHEPPKSNSRDIQVLSLSHVNMQEEQKIPTAKWATTQSGLRFTSSKFQVWVTRNFVSNVCIQLFKQKRPLRIIIIIII